MKKSLNDAYASISIVNHNLLISIPGDMSDEDIEMFSEIIMSRGYHNKLSGAVFDFSAVAIMDSFLYSYIANTTKALQLMGVTVVWTSLNPGVVMALMDINMNNESLSVATAVSMEYGIDILNNYMSTGN